MNRRTFIQASAAVVGGAALLPLGCGASGSAGRVEILPRPGIQLYTLRNLFADDVEGTLAQLAETGYRQVETHTYYGRTPQEMRSLLDEMGLTSPSAHYDAMQLRNDLDEVIEAAQVLGHEYVICPHPGGLPYETLDDYRAMGEFFNGVGEQFREAGIRFGYHNHAFEFERIDGEIPLYALLDNSEPENVVMELDLFWAVDGGVDPVEVIKRYPGRIHAYHVKDRTAEGEMVDVGHGVIDFERIFAHNDEAGLRYAFVEHDNPSDPMDSARNSFEYLAEMRQAE
ncbi:MAG: sugar phosphate isomerase/epimerase family protein [Bacteroidota bacterium]